MQTDTANEIPGEEELAPLARARRGHPRLIVFFVVLAAACSALGVRLLQAARSDDERLLILAASVCTACALGLGGVLYQRLVEIHFRWRETEEYLARIRGESAKYRALLEGAADMLLLVDTQGLVCEENAIARSLLGLSHAAGCEPWLEAIVVSADMEAFHSSLNGALQAPGVPVSHGELRVRDREGKRLVVDARVVAIDLEESRVLLLALRDLTAQKHMEHQLEVRERLSSLGLLTAGVAHEINNPLEGIGNYLSLAAREGLDPLQRARYLEAVGLGFARIRDIARDLLRFARPSREGGRSADLVQVVTRAVSLVRLSEHMKGVEIVSEGLDVALYVVGDPGQLEQVLVNLLINACKASEAPAGPASGADGRPAPGADGTAAGAMARVRLRARAVRDGGASPTEIELSVEDDGPGIPERDLERVFDPFYSTTGGTGLGLAVSYGIVTAHGGTIRARNREEGGACFTIRLPWSSAPTCLAKPSEG